MPRKNPNMWQCLPRAAWAGAAWASVAWALAAFVLPAASAAAAPEVTGVRLGENRSATRFVLDLNQSVEYRIFTLANPYRVVVDMPEVKWRLRSEVPVAKGGLVTALRFGRFTPQTSRVVLDLAGPAAVAKSFILVPRDGARTYRLVVDLRPVSAAEFVRLAARRGVARGLKPSRKVPLLPKPKAPRNGRRVVVLDPGHGGIDPGTTGRRGTREKVITLALAKEVKRQLEATGRYRVVLTRERDYFVRLRERVARARRAGGQLFMSFHADSIPDRRTRGASVYTLSEKASDAEADALAAKENRSDLIAGVDLDNETDEVANILIDLAQRETMNLSARFAAILVAQLGQQVKLLRRSHRFAGFGVLKAPDIPSVLIEVGYLSNRTDEELLRQPAHRAKVARGVVRAVDRFFKQTDKLTRS